jgi:N-acetylglucosamine-6-sulfatase
MGELVFTRSGKKVRHLLAVAAVLATAVLSAAGCGAEVHHTSQKPNIIFVLTDDQFPGSEHEMPFLNRNVTNEGVEFTNMVSTFPLCCPGRATIQRGQYSHNTHIYGNSLPAGGWQKFKTLGEHKSTMATWQGTRQDSSAST